MNKYPLWKYLLVIFIAVFGILYATPNLFGEDPVIQISANGAVLVDNSLKENVEDTLNGTGIPFKEVERKPGKLLVRFHNEADQFSAQELISNQLGSQYVVALNLAPATPSWFAAFGAKPMFLGLDLRGGVHFLMQVDTRDVLEGAQKRLNAEIKAELRSEKVRAKAGSFKIGPEGAVKLSLKNEADKEKAVSIIEGMRNGVRIQESGLNLSVAYTEESIIELKSQALEQNITTLRKRVNELGVAEPVVQRQGDDRVVVQLPGVQDPGKAKIILGKIATLEFRMVDESYDPATVDSGSVPLSARLFKRSDGSSILLERRILLTGEYIIDAAAGRDQERNLPAVFITLDNQGSILFGRRTAERVGRPMAVVFKDTKVDIQELADGRQEAIRETEETVINVATIQEKLGKRFQITGLDTFQEAQNLALLLRAGSLAAPIHIVEERTIGPSAGKDNIDKGFNAVLIGLILVLVLMAIYYRVFGLIADVALVVNLILIFAVLSLLQATLTLPGIAGIVLTVGMSVDANVLIFERIREELRAGNSPQASINAGYEKALSTIADANITTFIVAIILFALGTGPVKGFAVTLSIGILTSMFTAIIGTRALVNLVYGNRRTTRLAI